MTGYIKITAATRDGHQGLEVKTDVQDVSIMDRIQVLDALCRSLKFSPKELTVRSMFMNEEGRKRNGSKR